MIPRQPTEAMIAAAELKMPQLGRLQIRFLYETMVGVLPSTPPDDLSKLVSPSDPLVMLAGIKQFGLAPDGSDLRDLATAIRSLTEERDELCKMHDAARGNADENYRRLQVAEADKAALTARVRELAIALRDALNEREWLRSLVEDQTCSDLCDKTHEFQGCPSGTCAKQEGRKKFDDLTSKIVGLIGLEGENQDG